MTRGKINVGRPDQYPTDPFAEDPTVGYSRGRVVIGVEYGSGSPESAVGADPGLYVVVDDIEDPGVLVDNVLINSGTDSIDFENDLVLPVWHETQEGDLIGYQLDDEDVAQGATGSVTYTGTITGISTEDPNTGGGEGEPIGGATGDLIAAFDIGVYLWVYDGAFDDPGTRWRAVRTIAGVVVQGEGQIGGDTTITDDDPREDAPDGTYQNITGRGQYGPGSLMAWLELFEGGIRVPRWYEQTGRIDAPTWVEFGGDAGGGTGTELRSPAPPDEVLARVQVGNEDGDGFVDAFVNSGPDGFGNIRFQRNVDGYQRNSLAMDADGSSLDSRTDAGARAALQLDASGDNIAQLEVRRADSSRVGRVRIDDDGGYVTLNAYDPTEPNRQGMVSIEPGATALIAFDNAGLQRATSIVTMGSDPTIEHATNRADGTSLATIRILSDGATQLLVYDEAGDQSRGLVQINSNGEVYLGRDVEGVEIAGGAVKITGDLRLPGTVAAAPLAAAPTTMLEVFDGGGASLGYVPIYALL